MLRQLLFLIIALFFCNTTAGAAPILLAPQLVVHQQVVPQQVVPQQVVPKPKKSLVDHGAKGFQLPQVMTVSATNAPQFLPHLNAFASAIKLMQRPVGELKLLSASELGATRPALAVTKVDSLPPAHYRIEVDASGICLEAADLKGLSHATATLLQLLGQASRRDNGTLQGNGTLPAMKIDDGPDSSYRSLMIDLGRNPHHFDSLLETIDLLWFYKVDSLHLHLTDDQHFAFPSRAFPKLQSSNALISRSQFEQLESYASARGVTLIPELEVPGHCGILCRAYPEVFGKNSTEVASLESSRVAIKVLLDEMIELFPASSFVHIGGDEAFGVPEELQRELINELHHHLKSRGKKTLVWEGPALGRGDNKVNAEVIHINWRTINFPADQMLDAGYEVVNAAWDPLYIVDHYPRNNFTMASPQHIYETLDRFRFKHFNPNIKTFAQPINVQPTDRVIGFCMPWWEGREQNYFPMVTPRLIPLAEVAWNEGPRNVADFRKRVSVSELIRQQMFYPVEIEAGSLAVAEDGVFHDQVEITLRATQESDAVEIYFTVDGSMPTADSERYTQPILLDRSTSVRAALFDAGSWTQIGHGSRRKFVCVNTDDVDAANVAFMKPVTTSATSGAPFSIQRITDGGTGNLDYYLGYPAEPKPISITIDLEKVHEVNRIVVHACSVGSSWESYVVSVSADGKAFTRVADRSEKPEQPAAFSEHRFFPVSARFVRIDTAGCKDNVFDSFSRIAEVEIFSR